VGFSNPSSEIDSINLCSIPRFLKLFTF
jgi:hypothetical protein